VIDTELVAIIPEWLNRWRDFFPCFGPPFLMNVLSFSRSSFVFVGGTSCTIEWVFFYEKCAKTGSHGYTLQGIIVLYFCENIVSYVDIVQSCIQELGQDLGTVRFGDCKIWGL